MEGKKISFGFMKTKTAKKQVDDDKKDFIDCLEEKAIKIIGDENIEEVAPLVIPMKPNTLVTAERLKQIAEEVEKGIEETNPIDTNTNEIEKQVPPANDETIEQMAVRELIQDAKKEVKIETPMLMLPVMDKTALEGQKESTLQDYESIPIQDFGMAMLRGMGWTPGNNKSQYKQPQLRPKGLGLGADKVIKENQKKNATKDKDEELSIVKNAYVKIVVGKYNGCYGKVVSLDEDNGRVMVDIAVKKETVSLSEFMMQPVSKSEFEKQSRVINADKYEEYKKNEASSSNKSKYSKDDRKDDKPKHAYEKSSNGKSRDRYQRRNSSSSEERYKRKPEKKKYSSNESISSLSESEKVKSYKKNRKHYSGPESDSSDSSKKYKKSKSRNRSRTPKRDIDKKRKGKKKKRDRDRSPNYRKHKNKN